MQHATADLHRSDPKIPVDGLAAACPMLFHGAVHDNQPGNARIQTDEHPLLANSLPSLWEIHAERTVLLAVSN